MATDLGQPRGGVRKSIPASRYEAFARGKLARVESRIRAFDLTAALFGFAAGTLAFALLMIFVDRRWELSAPVRQAAFLGYLIASVVYLAVVVARPLRRRVNPYYAALKLEETLPEAKNSVINWVDLHESELAPAITAAVGQRAARDLAKADLEQAVNGKKAGWAGGLAGILFVLFVTAFILFGPRQFFSLFRRSFLPFEGGGISRQTILTLLRPEGGNAVVAIGRSVSIAVQVTGRLPDPKGPEALRLLYRYQVNDPFIERPLQREGDEWAVTINAFEVQNGFWYKVAGGDGETAAYRISVRSTPLLTDFRATYHFRPYTGRPAELRRERRLEAVRGTEVALRVRTNRPVQEAFVDLGLGASRKPIRADRVEGDPQSFQTRFILEESTLYRIRYNSTEGESYIDPVDFPITVHVDKAPFVELTKPGQDVTLPANGVLNLEGNASDDFGVKELVLRLQLDNGRKLKGQPYRSEKALKLPSGGHPATVAYKDFVDLARAPGPDGKPFPFVPGQKLEYWLEATDACDYPQANVGTSTRYRVTIAEPEKNPAQRQKERDKAEQEKKQHEARQDEQIKKEEQQRQEEKERSKEEINKQDDPMNEAKEKGSKSDKGDPKGQPGNSEENKGEDKKDQAGNDPKGDQGPENQQDIKDQEEKLKKALKKKEEKQGKQQDGADQGNNNQKDGAQEAKGKENEPGQKEPDANQKDEAGGKNGKGKAKDDTKQEAGKDKPAGQQAPKSDKGGAKDQRPQPGGEKPGDNKESGKGKRDTQAAAKDPGNDKPGQDPKGLGKDGKPQPMNGNQPGQGKEDGKGDQTSKPADGKPGQPGGAKTGEEKPSSKDQPSAAKSDGKDAGAKGQTADTKPTGDAREKPDSAEKGEGKGSSDRPGMKDPKANPRDGGERPQDGQTPRGEDKQDKQAPAKGDRDKVAKGQTKDDRQPTGQPEERRDNLAEEMQRVLRLTRDLKSKDKTTREKAEGELERMTADEYEEFLQDYKDLLDGKQPDRLQKKRAERDHAEGKEAATGKTPGKDDKSQAGKNDGQEKGIEKDGSSGDGAKGKGDTKDAGKPGNDGASKPGQQGKPGDGAAAATGKDKDGKSGKTPGSGLGEGNNRTGEGDDQPAPEPKPEAARFRDRAGVLQLEEFKRKVDRNVLKDAKISEEEYRTFLKSYEEMLKKSGTQARKPEVLPGPQSGSTLPSIGARKVAPTGKANDIKAGSRPQPPPRYRDAYREFTRQPANPADREGK